MNYTPTIEPTWVANDAVNLKEMTKAKFNDIQHDPDKYNLPDLFDVVVRGKKLRYYFENPRDKDKTKYYVVATNGKKLLLLAEDGFVYSAAPRAGYGEDPLKDGQYLGIIGIYFRKQAAPSAVKAPGLFVQCGDDEQTDYLSDSEQYYFPGTRMGPLSLRSNCLSDLLYATTGTNLLVLATKLEATKSGTIFANTKFTENGGDDHTHHVYEALTHKYIGGTISFKCLSRFFLPDNLSAKDPDSVKFSDLITTLRQSFSSERIVLNGISEDNTVSVPVRDAGDVKALADTGLGIALRNELPVVQKYRPGRGYVCTEVCYNDAKTSITYHLSGNSLFTDSVSHKQVVMGVDEDAYFGCELKPECGRHTLPQDALLSLAPTEARIHPKRKVSELKTGVVRQGEWFLVPYPSGEYPSPLDLPGECLLVTEYALPRETSRDSFHYTTGDMSGVDLHDLPNELLSWVHLPSGTIWTQQCCLQHSRGEHEDTSLNDARHSLKDAKHKNVNNYAWRIVRNLAARSFSEQGVD
jgi:hypothetical protein